MKKILVVDNHLVFLKFMKDLLTKHGHSVLTAEDGLSALDLLQTYTPDIMFIDLIMPNIDGKKFCRIIRRMPDFKNVYLVIISGVAAEAEVDFAELEVNACIAKGPFDEMAQNVLQVIEESEKEIPPTRSRLVLGQECLKPREVTKELLALNRNFELILESMTEGILVVTSDNRVIYANPSAKAMVGMSEEKLLGVSAIELFHVKDRPWVAERLKEVNVHSKKTTGNAPVSLDGRQITLSFLPIIEEGRGAIIILNDLTEQKRMEAMLQQAQKMEAIGLLAGGIAHDFNNILTAVVGNISLAKMYAKPSDKVYSKLEEAEKASLMAKDLTLQLLTFARGGSPVKKPASIADIVKDCCKYALSASQCLYEFSASDDLWSVGVDKGQISQAIHHILTNAAQAMPEGGTIRIRAENLEVEEKYQYSIKPGKYVKLTFTDEGEGIPKQYLSRIFDPYFTTKKKSNGLGLTISYSIIKNHNGYISVDSELHQGTTFFVYLPAMADAVDREEKGSKKPFSGSGKILVMDDEQIVRQVVGEMLEFIGFEVDFAINGEEAIRLYLEAKESGEPFDAIIMDLTVPEGMGGKEAIQELRKLDPDVKAVVSSGYSNDPIMSEYRQYGFNGVVRKPFKIEDLGRTLRQVLAS